MRPAMSRALGVALLCFCAFPASHAKKMMYNVTMRDGFNLSTLVHCNELLGPKRKTVIFEASTYGHEDLERIAVGVSDALGDGYCSVGQDMRGSGDSQGVGQDFTLWRSQGNDSYDTFQWIAQQEWSNGEIYQTGASADGIAAIVSWMENPKQLQKQFVMWASMHAHGLTYPGGAYREGLIGGWLHHFKGQYDRLIDTVRVNEAPGDFYTPVNLTGHCPETYVSSVMLAGWYDIFLSGHLEAYDCYRQGGKPTYLVVQACGHCMGQKCPIYLAEDLRIEVSFAMMLDLFAGRDLPSEIKNVTFYVLGAGDAAGNFIDPFAPGNYWTSLEAFPTFVPTRYYFTPSGGMSLVPGATESELSYLYDPADPVPTVGGNNLELKCGALDQSGVESANRSDVLTFTSEVLTEDLAITGPLMASLSVASNCTDTDFTAKLTHVTPSGQSRLINDGIVRMRWRQGVLGGAEAQLMQPGTRYEVEVSLWNTSFIFPKGHRWRVDISSSNSPRFEANPNNGLPLTQKGAPIVAKNTLVVGGPQASYFTLPVVQQEQLPKVHFNILMEKWLADRPASYRTGLAAFKEARQQYLDRMYPGL
eukprot:TRINITY_DN18004_c0_g7_i1.p2 TRINITY_DN18004_c0_g7~~TRINITY_DN18004_c0_g7_i1.p2  ORF type:complete len:602 (+),score=254.27 TRINITY_DN18004_c0_g7_i1:41-1807(+)